MVLVQESSKESLNSVPITPFTPLSVNVLSVVSTGVEIKNPTKQMFNMCICFSLMINISQNTSLLIGNLLVKLLKYYGSVLFFLLCASTPIVWISVLRQNKLRFPLLFLIKAVSTLPRLPQSFCQKRFSALSNSQLTGDFEVLCLNEN